MKYAPHLTRTRAAGSAATTAPAAETVVRANLRQLEQELQGELDELLSQVSARESASRALESQLMELSEALAAAQQPSGPSGK